MTKIKFHLEQIRFKDVLDISKLDIPLNCLTCIVGESGSGKTTLLRLLNHLISPDSGTIEIDGQSINDWDPIKLRRTIVMLPQNPVMFEGTVRDNMLIGLRFSEKPMVGDSELLRLLDALNMHVSLDADSASLSGGEKQRIGLARVLLLDPSVLLLDEPSSALDEGTARQVLGKLLAFSHEKGKTIVMVTHSSDIVKNFAENIVRIERGQLAGEADEYARQ